MARYLTLTKSGRVLVLAKPDPAPNSPPATPTLTATVTGPTTATLTGSAYSDPDGDAQAARQWQVALTADVGFGSPVLDTGDDPVHLTSLPVTGLTASTGYIARCRDRDGPGAYSDWSTIEAFATDAAPVGGATLLASVSITNTSATASDARTIYGLGHPFKQGDIPAGSRLRATWTPSGGSESAALTVQVDRRVSWPDGSFRFARVAVAHDAIPGAGLGALKLYSEAGTQDATIPGGRTAAQIAADLASGAFTGSNGGTYEVTLTKLTKGRESITIGSGGSGYLSTDPVSLDGTPLPAETLVVNGSGTITAINFQSPDPRLDPTGAAPTVTVASAAGTGASLTYNHPALDGSGTWTWSLADQLSLLGTTDAAGRASRCEVIESGPLCVTFAGWGPIRSAGADHPHLCVWYWCRCWLYPTGHASAGSIDRVESFFAASQGWIEDIAGGTTKADLAIADIAVTLGGVALSGYSWSSVRIWPYSEHALVTLDSTNWHLGGSRWTSGWPSDHVTLFPAFDTAYWRSTGLVPPYPVEDYVSAPVVAIGLEATPSTYAPGPSIVTDAGVKYVGQCPAGINAVGDGPHLGLLPRWAAKAFITQDADLVRSDIATALRGAQLPNRWRNPVTGRIANLSATYGNQTAATMGTVRPNTQFVSPAKGGSTSADFALEPPVTGLANGDPTNSFGGWIPDTGYTTDHFPSFAYQPYLRTGQPWFLETIKVHAHNPVVGWITPGTDPANTASNQVGTRRNLILPDGSTLSPRFTSMRGNSNVRSEGWAWKLLAQCLAVLPDDAIERAYFEQIHADNSAAAVAIIDAGTANFKAGGYWMWPQPTWTLDAGHPGYIDSPWMQHYVFVSRAFEYLALGGPADTLAFLNHHIKQIRIRNGGDAGNPCGYGGTTYRTLVGSGADWFGPADIPHTLWQTGVSLDAATGRLSAASSIVTAPFADTSLQVGDLCRFAPLLDAAGAIATLPPASGTSGGSPVAITMDQWYYLATVDASAGGHITISPNDDLSNPFTVFSASASGCALAFRKASANCPTPSATAGSVLARKSAEANAGQDAGVLGGVVKLAVACGVIDTTDALYVNTWGPSGRVKYLVDNRWTTSATNAQSYPTWVMAEAL